MIAYFPSITFSEGFFNSSLKGRISKCGFGQVFNWLVLLRTTQDFLTLGGWSFLKKDARFTKVYGGEIGPYKWGMF